MRRGEPEGGVGCGGAEGGAPRGGPSGARCVTPLHLGGKGHVEGGTRPPELEKRLEEEEEEEEEEQEEEEEEDEEEGEGRAIPQDDADEVEFDASRDNDGFLEYFARELDDASSCGEDLHEHQDDIEDESEGDQGGDDGDAGGEATGVEAAAAAKDTREDDEQIAWALQVSEPIHSAVVWYGLSAVLCQSLPDQSEVDVDDVLQRSVHSSPISSGLG